MKRLTTIKTIPELNNNIFVQGNTLFNKKTDKIIHKKDINYNKIVKETNQYKNSLFSKDKAEKDLKEIYKEKDWDYKLSISADYKYGSSIDENTDISGSFYIEKDLYSPVKDIAFKQAELRYEKAKLALENTEKNITINIENIKRQLIKTKRLYQESIEEYNKRQKTFQKDINKNEKGYISTLSLKEKRLELLNLQKDIIINKKSLYSSRIF